MKTISGFLIVLLSLALLAAVLYGGYFAVLAGWNYLNVLELDVRIVLISAMLCVLVASIIVASAIKSSARTAATSCVTTKKIDLYEDLIEIYFSSNRTGSELEKLRPKVVLLASEPVLEIFEKLTSIADNDIDYRNKTAGLYTQLIKKIRLELGHKSSLSDFKYDRLFAVDERIDVNSRQSL